MQWEPLLLLHFKRADTVAALARESQVNCGAMTRMLDRLEQKQLAAPSAQRDDRRVVHLELTDKGRAVGDEITAIVRDELNASCAASATERSQPSSASFRACSRTAARMEPRMREGSTNSHEPRRCSPCGAFACGLRPAARKAPPPQAATEVGVLTLAPRTRQHRRRLAGPHGRLPRRRGAAAGVAASCRSGCSTEGGDVAAGEQLFQIDPATYRAALQPAQAAPRARASAARKAEAARRSATGRCATNEPSASRTTTTPSPARARPMRTSRPPRRRSRAARINVVYSQVLSPIAGRIGRTHVTEGALVTSQQSRPLATVQQLDPIYVDITQSSVEMLKLQRRSRAASSSATSKNEAEVTLTLEDGTDYAEHGKLQFAEVSVDPSTGAVVLRALFPNPQRELLPGMFVRAQLTQAMKHDALLVPQRGVTRNQRGDAVVLVVGDDNKVAERTVTTARAIGNDWLVTTGLRAGERVIVDGSAEDAARRGGEAGRGQRGAVERGGRARRPASRSAEAQRRDLALLHRPSRLRVGARDRADARGRHRRGEAAGDAVPGHRAAAGRDQRQLSGRVRADRAGHGRAGHRAAAERHRQPRLHHVGQQLRRHRARSRSRSRRARTPTSRRCRCRTSCSSRCRCCRRRSSSRASA